ncbi:Ubiquitin-conjugating enzyme E2 T [Podila clonocystis]|nr:Ubiquitin-conjugating enzyme E2 T [Podila clonocystis]
MTTNLGRTMVRMKKELEELEDSPREGIICYPIDDDNITHLHAEVSGPEDTPYFGGTFKIDIQIPERQGNWGPAMSIPTVLLSLRVLLSNPNPDDPLLVEVAAEYKEDRALFQHKAAKYTQKYAMGNGTETETINHVMTHAEIERVSNTNNTATEYQFTRIESAITTCRYGETIAYETHAQTAESEYEIEVISLPQPAGYHPYIAHRISTHT